MPRKGSLSRPYISFKAKKGPQNMMRKGSSTRIYWSIYWVKIYKKRNYTAESQFRGVSVTYTSPFRTILHHGVTMYKNSFQILKGLENVF